VRSEPPGLSFLRALLPTARSTSGPAGPVEAGAEGVPYGLWGRAFRPFFLLGAVHAALVVPWWTLVWLGMVPAPGWAMPTWWHAHEMLFGFVAAAIAGFLLTAAPVWSGRPALTGAPLAGLVGLWLAGRVAMAAAGVLPPWLVAAVDVAFLPMLALVVARTLWGAEHRRNHGVVAIVSVLALVNVGVHAEVLGHAPGVAGRALRFGVDLVVVLLLVIGGRITPAFTRNALRARGVDAPIVGRAWVDRCAIAAAAALAVVSLVAGRSMATGLLAAIAGAAALARLAGWRTLHTLRDPLLWSLHAGAGWLVVGLLLVAASDLGGPVPATAGLHALTVGAMGTTIMAVTTRVGLGHTGRALVLPRGAVACYVLVHGAAAARVASPFLSADPQRVLLLVAAVAWGAAFGLFALLYAPILTAPRDDGLPG